MSGAGQWRCEIGGDGTVRVGPGVVTRRRLLAQASRSPTARDPFAEFVGDGSASKSAVCLQCLSLEREIARGRLGVDEGDRADLIL